MFKSTEITSFFDRRMKCLMYLSLYVSIVSSSPVLKLLKTFGPNREALKLSFIENPLISSIALQYLA